MKVVSLLCPLGLILVLVAARQEGGSPIERLVLNKEVYTEGASFGDVNGDGATDL